MVQTKNYISHFQQITTPYYRQRKKKNPNYNTNTNYKEEDYYKPKMLKTTLS